jgi:hypothetical protein
MNERSLTSSACSWFHVCLRLFVAQYQRVKVEVVATEASLTFFNAEDIEKAGSRVWRNKDEWLARMQDITPPLPLT